MVVREITNEEFKNFSKQYPISSLYQTPEYAFSISKQNYEPLFVGLINDNGETIGASLVLIEKIFGFKYAYTPRGFLIDYTDKDLLKRFTTLLKKFLGKKDVIAIKMCPPIIRYSRNIQKNIVMHNTNYDTIFNNLKETGYYHLGYNNYFEALKPRFEAIIDLTIPYYQLFKNINKSYRTKIRTAEKNFIKIYKGTIDDLQYLYFHTKDKYPRNLKYFQDCFEAFSRNDEIDFFYAKIDTQNYLKYSQYLYEQQEKKCEILNNKIIAKSHNKTINEKLHADKILTIRKKQLIDATSYLRDNPNGIILASALVVKNKKTVTLLIDGYDKNYQHLSAKHLLIWKLIEKYSKEKFERFSLGGITNPELKDNKFKGLNNFKINFNPTIYEYIGDLELVTNQALYFMYRNAAPIRSILKK